MRMIQLIGRDNELARIEDAFLDARDSSASVVLVQGDAGCGKTALVEAVVDRFRAGGMGGASGSRVVWRATADGEEQLTEYGVVDQLLSHAGQQPGSSTKTEPSGAPRDVLIAKQILQQLSEQGHGGVGMLVVDDVHWCDHASRQVLGCLLRRLVGQPVVVVLTQRPAAGWPQAWERPISRLAAVRIDLGGLSVADVRALLAFRGLALTPRAGHRLHAHTAGNPQLVLTLAAELNPEELCAGEGSLPAPRSFVDWVSTTFQVSDPATRAVVAAVAVLGGATTLANLASMTGLVDAGEAVDSAIALRLLKVVPQAGERLVDVEHALVRAAVTQSLSFTEHARLHSRAATLTPDPLRAMLHRLQACSSFDPELVEEAVVLADTQAAGGACLASAHLLNLAAGLLPPGVRRHDVLVNAAERLLRIGEVRWAEQLLATVADEWHREPTPHELLVNGYLALQLRQTDRALQSLGDAWRLGQDPRVVAGAAELLAFLSLDAGDGESATVWATRAIEAADTRLVALECAGTVLASGWALRGDLAPARRLLETHEARLAGTASAADLHVGLALADLWGGDVDGATARLLLLRDAPDNEGSVLRSTVRLAQAELDYRRGHWDEVLISTGSEAALVDEGWDTHMAPMVLAVGAFVLAARGQSVRAETFLESAEALMDTSANLAGRMMLSLGRARLASARGDLGDVVRVLEPLVTTRNECLDGVNAWRSELAEAYVGVGRTKEASTLLIGRDLREGNPHALSGLQRAAGTVAAATGRHDLAVEMYEKAMSAGPEVSGPFVHARAAHAYGAFVRRLGQRRKAADLLEVALAGFTTLKATPWMAQARQELSRCALRRGATAPGLGELTPAETVVARLAVAGQTNREIAQSLTLSIKTVETHLGRIFIKLGVRHRVELVTVLSRLPAAEVAS